MRKKIGIVSAGWNDEYQGNILKGITDACAQFDFDTLSFTSINIDFANEQNNCAYNIYNLLNAQAVDGVILVINTIYYPEVIQKIFEQVEQMHIPAICVDSEHRGMMSIGTDNYASARIMIEHLLEGDQRKRFACLTGVAFNPENEIRVKAFKDVMTERLGGYDEAYIYPGDFQYDCGYQAADYFHNSDLEYPDALFCCNDKMAAGFMDRSLALGYRIPEDIKIVGFDNTTWSTDATVPLSSMECPLEEIGHKAVEMLKSAFEGNNPGQKEMLVGIPHFRKSTGVTQTLSQEELQRLYDSNILQTKKDKESLFLANLMIENFSFCSSVDAFLKRLQSIIRRIPSNEFYLCLTPEQMQSMGDTFEVEKGEPLRYMLEGYPSHMYMIMHYEDGSFYEPQIFETKNILPVFTSKDKRTDYVISPLYFMGKTHGYFVLGNCNEVAYRAAFQTWGELLSYAVNNIYLRHDLEQKAQKLEYLHERDYMTETYNRLGFRKQSEQMLRQCVDANAQMMVLFADMDDMKYINDTFGHDEGDIAICAFSDILKNTCQNREIVARFGGDEMVVLGIHYTPDMAEEFVARFRKDLNAHNTVNTLYELKISIGYELYTPDFTTDIEECVRKADEKMYKEKRRRKEANKT